MNVKQPKFCIGLTITLSSKRAKPITIENTNN